MRFLLLFFCCVISLSQAQARLDFDRATCRELFDEADRRAGYPINFQELLTKPAQTQTVFFMSSEPGTYGGQIWRFRSTGPWNSLVSSSGRDFQGDPRMIILALGRATAEFLGFRQVGRNLWAPDAIEFNARLDLLNTVSERKTQIRFYNLPTESPLVEPEFYLQKFLDSLLPVAVRGIPQLHDLAYHYLAILLPDHVIAHAQRLTRFVLELSYFLENQSDASYVRETAYLLRVARSLEIDAGTANLATLTVAGIAHSTFDFTDFTHSAITEPLLKNARSAHDLLWAELNRKSSDYFPQFNQLPYGQHLHLRQLVMQFLALKKQDSEFMQGFGTTAQKWPVMTQEICKEIQLQRIALIEAHEKLKARAISR